MRYLKLYKEHISSEKDKYGFDLIKVRPKTFVYHLTKYENRESILEHGLLPMKSKTDWHGVKNDYPPCIFVNNTGTHSKWFNWDIDKNRDVWEIYTGGLNNIWYIDFNLSEYGKDYLVTFEPIPVECLTLKYDSNEYKWIK
jgi:hypothetical protein